MLKSFLTRFTRDEEGGIAVETALIFPMLCWGYLATFVYFNAFHTQNTTLKAAYTISDQISRETGYITPSYLKGLYRLHEVLTNSNEPTVMRLSVIEYDSEEEEYRVRWSKQVEAGRIYEGSNDVLNNVNITDYDDQFPVMPDNEVVLVVQNWLVHEPAFSIGLEAFSFENLVVTRPRFNSAQVCWNSEEDGNSETATC